MTRALSLLCASALLGACVVEEPYYEPQQPVSQDYPPPAQPAYGDVGAYDDGADGGGQIYVQATVAPPPLPVYEQPPCPAPGYLWTPGYWAYAADGYFWVPGTWVLPPRVGLLWTPGYWGWSAGVYVFHAGYWGPHVGFYGGIDYGGGYLGTGFVGGRWDRDEFVYNRAVMNVDQRVVHNTYNQTVINNTVINNVTINRVSYAGGPGGLRAVPTPQERLAARDPHVARTSMQVEQIRAAGADRAQFVRYNGGRPPVAATPRPRAFDSPHVVPARGAVVPPRGSFAPPRAAPGRAPLPGLRDAGDAGGGTMPRAGNYGDAGAPSMQRSRGLDVPPPRMQREPPSRSVGGPPPTERPMYPLQRSAPTREYQVPGRGPQPPYRQIERGGGERRPQSAYPPRGRAQPAKPAPQKDHGRPDHERN